MPPLSRTLTDPTHSLPPPLPPVVSSGWFVGYIVLASQIVQLLLMGDYMFYYVKSLRSGGPMLLPTAHV